LKESEDMPDGINDTFPNGFYLLFFTIGHDSWVLCSYFEDIVAFNGSGTLVLAKEIDGDCGQK
jgi:hypothetical protein